MNGSVNTAISRAGKLASNSELLQRHAALFHNSGKKQTYIGGYNHYVKATDGSNNDPSIHAECQAIKKFIEHYSRHNVNNAKIRRKLHKTSLIVVRLNNNKTSVDVNACMFSNSNPCSNCLATIRKFGIKKIIVSNDYGECRCKKGESNRTFHTI